MKKLFVVHPLLFALFSVLALYSYNVAEVAPSEIVLPTAIVLGFALVALLLWGLILRNLKKAGLVLSIFVILFFSYGHVANAVEGWGITYKVLLPIWGILIIGGAFFAIRTRRDLLKLTTILNVVAITLVVIPSINIVVHEVRAASHQIEKSEIVDTNAVDLGDAYTLRDIYYIVLDRYASASTLEEVYGFDNSEFLDYLSGKGFYVASESVSNYLKTRYSLASSLNMQYINYLGEELGEGFTDLGPVYAMLQDYEVSRFLRAKGYTYLHFGATWEPTRTNNCADMNITYGDSPEFMVTLFETTMLHPVLEDNRLGQWLDELPAWLASPFVDGFRVDKWEGVLYEFDKLAEVPAIEEPTFVLAHMFVPHEPFVFDRDGNYVSLEEEEERGRNAGYVDQLIFTNKKLMGLVDEIVSTSEVPPIIILQADEGPRPERYKRDEYYFKWEEATDAELKEKMRILNAYYLPNVDYDRDLYPSITPVNSFRLVFNLYFDTEFDLLVDRNYAIHSDKYPYKFFDVTEKVKYD